jgi:hypothetical protein
MQNRGAAAVGNTVTHTRELGCSRAGTSNAHKNAIQKYDLRSVRIFSFSYVTRVSLTTKLHVNLPSEEPGFQNPMYISRSCVRYPNDPCFAVTPALLLTQT